jgi:hypothetical protein
MGESIYKSKIMERKSFQWIQSLGFAKIWGALFLLTTIIALFIVYRNINNKIAISFVIGYVAFAFLSLLMFPILVIRNARYFSWPEIGRRCGKFLAIFIALAVASHLFLIVFAPSRVGLLKESSIAFGAAFGISFSDIFLFRKKAC